MADRPAPPAEADLVFNVVWTGVTFPTMRYFVQSLMAHTEARFRFVANQCAPDQVEAMERFRSLHPEQVVEVLDVSPDVLESHGFCLEAVRRQRADGDWFSLVDPDIKAVGPFVADLAADLADADVVTSGTEVWTDSNVVPAGHPGVAGEHFFTPDGFVFGSPHLAIYRRSVLDATIDRWGIYFGSAGPDLSDPIRSLLAERGALYHVYDTAKVVNAMIQVDGGTLTHREIGSILHIGGLAHYVSPEFYIEGPDGQLEPEWTRWRTSESERRHAVTRFTAAVLQAAQRGQPPPAVPDDVDAPMASKLTRVRAEIVDLVDRYRDEAEPRR